MTDRHQSAKGTGATEGLPTERLKQEAQNLLGAVAERALLSASDKIDRVTHRLAERIDEGGPGMTSAVGGITALAKGKSPARAAVGAGAAGLKEKAKSMFGGKGGKSGGRGKGGKSALKITNIVEQMDVGLPRRLVYDQWTQFEQFPSFMKKVEGADQETDEKVNWKAQILWSHRNWESTIIEQVPDDHIVWRSKGPKGYVDGVVTFSELAPNLTRILLVLEYHPQGFFEHTGNLWRAQGRRVRLELKHFRRHVMSHVILRPDEVEGWRGEIRDGEVVRTHEQALAEERDRETGETGEAASEPGEGAEKAQAGTGPEADSGQDTGSDAEADTRAEETEGGEGGTEDEGDDKREDTGEEKGEDEQAERRRERVAAHREG